MILSVGQETREEKTLGRRKRGSGRRGGRREGERERRADRRGQDPTSLMWGLFSLVPTEARVVTPQPAKTEPSPRKVCVSFHFFNWVKDAGI